MYRITLSPSLAFLVLDNIIDSILWFIFLYLYTTSILISWQHAREMRTVVNCALIVSSCSPPSITHMGDVIFSLFSLVAIFVHRVRGNFSLFAEISFIVVYMLVRRSGRFELWISKSQRLGMVPVRKLRLLFLLLRMVVAVAAAAGSATDFGLSEECAVEEVGDE